MYVQGMEREPDLSHDEGLIRPGTGSLVVSSVAKRVLHEGVLYQLEYRRCGRYKPGKGRPNGCRCKSNDPRLWHGPYPFAYTTRKARGGAGGGAGGWCRVPFPDEAFVLLGIKRTEGAEK